MPEPEELFAAVDALLARPADLPPPPERERLRKAAKVSQAAVAQALRVRRETVVAWEAGRNEPRSPQREAYARLLEGWAAKYPAPPGPRAPQAAPAPATAREPDAPVLSAVEPDRDTEGELVTGEPLPCAVCGGPTPYRMAGLPRHLGSFCGTPGAGTAAASGAGVREPAADPVAAMRPVPGQPSPAAVVDAQAPSTPASAAGTSRTSPSCSEVAGRPSSMPRRPARKRSSAPAEAVPAVDARFPNGPLAVLDGDGRAHLADGRTLTCPAGTVPALVEWVLNEAGLGAARLHRSGKDSDPLVVLTAAATERLGLPLELTDRRSLRLPDDHAVVRQLTKDEWSLTKRGFGPWARIYRPATDGRRHCVQLAVLPWDALDSRAWGSAGGLPPAELARLLGTYAARVITPRGSTAVNGLELMTALRPPTRAVKDETTGCWVPGPMPGSLTEPVDPAPPEAPDEHPAARGRTVGEAIDEEAYEWVRDPRLLTDEELARPYAVGIDVNTAFLAAAGRLSVGLGRPEYVKTPAFDKKLPGCWYVDLSHVEADPRLPSPFTPSGERPAGPGWYATPTVAYAVELGAVVEPIEAWIRPANGPYLDPWHARLRDAYLATMADLEVTKDLDEHEFLTAMEQHKEADPASVAVLSAIKATVKGGIGKLRERPQGARHRPGERWPALERPTWRPDIRAAVIAAARVNMHRKMVKTARVSALFPLAVLSDCVVYPSPGPSPLDILPHEDGKPVTGAFRLGVSPGMVKHEGTQPMSWAVELLEQGFNPARHIKGGDSVPGEGE